MRKALFAFLLVATPLAAASAMPVSEFLAKAEALQKKGAMAMFSRDLRVIMNEGKASSAALRAERLAAVKAGRKPGYCPPAKQSMTSTEVMKHMQSIPPARRSMSFKAALGEMLARKWPCPA